MPRLASPLTDRQLRAWIGKGRPFTRSDGSGLTFALSTAGTASWILRYRTRAGNGPGKGPGHRREFTLGRYPALPLAAAREQAARWRAAIAAGAEPGHEETGRRSAPDWTVQALVTDFIAKRLESPNGSILAPVTVRYRCWDLQQVIVPQLGARELAAVSTDDIVRLLRDCPRSWTIRRRILSSARQLFAYACGRRLIARNPCEGIDFRALMGPRPAVRRRLMLDSDELRTLFARGEAALGRRNALALRILLATCVRSSELRQARWDDIDLRQRIWRVPDAHVKTRVGFTVPLAPVVCGWFTELRALGAAEAAGGTDEGTGAGWVLPARGGGHIARTTLHAALARAFERGALPLRRFTPHDLRSTAKGHMLNLGIAPEVTELALNHHRRGIAAIYDVREDMPERREALARWAIFLVELAPMP